METVVKNLLRAALGALLLFVGWSLLRIFVCDRFVVPSDSMSPTLIAGDRILVEKLTAGARIYKSLDFGAGRPLRSFRVPGFGAVRVNDVVVFNVPRGYDRGAIEFRINYVYAKRCVGTPGDSVSVRAGFFRNNRYPGPIGDTVRQARLAATPDSLIAPYVLRALPYCSGHAWTIRELGPIYVPCRGGRVALDALGCELYRPVIEYETGRSLEFRDGAAWLGGERTEEYVFRGNYYFFCGDNVADSKDSRYWGFAPEEFIIGVVRRITSSKEPYTGRRRWSRCWKRVE